MWVYIAAKKASRKQP